MQEQISMYDVIIPAPTMYECMKTCRRALEHVDYPSWWFGNPRCLLPHSEHMKEVEYDNRSYIYCSLYERRDGP